MNNACRPCGQDDEMVPKTFGLRIAASVLCEAAAGLQAGPLPRLPGEQRAGGYLCRFESHGHAVTRERRNHCASIPESGYPIAVLLPAETESRNAEKGFRIDTGSDYSPRQHIKTARAQIPMEGFDSLARKAGLQPE